jgi:hypothetical protein
MSEFKNVIAISNDILIDPNPGVYCAWVVSRLSFSHVGIDCITSLLHEGAPKYPLGIFYQNANKVSTTKGEFPWRLLAKYANERKWK